MKLLLVDDEPKFVAYVRKGLSENGYAVDAASNGVDGLFLAATTHYDAVLLDVTMPRADGWSVVTKMRDDGMSTPILFVTACDGVSERVKGLDLGADDYLVKPFAFSELLARVRSVLRRRGPSARVEALRIADLNVDLIRQKVTRCGQRIDLTAKEFALLSLLARHPGEVLSRTVIAEQVWDMNFDSDTNVVDVAIRRLRSKVDDPFDLKLVHTYRGRGYALEAN
jgi:two-component system, OmpR family, copper resistance phosphate regulon response regulator CusR